MEMMHGMMWIWWVIGILLIVLLVVLRAPITAEFCA